MVFVRNKALAFLGASSSLRRHPSLPWSVRGGSNAPPKVWNISALPSEPSFESAQEEEQRPSSNDKVIVSAKKNTCMRAEGQPLIRVVEHGLPRALQTHEMVVDVESSSILTTQMEEGRLVRLVYDKVTGEISSKVSTVNMQMDVQDQDPFVGMHGLCPSRMFPGRVWVTLQYVNRICLVNIETLEVEATVVCPRELGSDIVGGPHCVTEANGRLYACMKGGASCHGASSGLTREMAEEATAYGVYRVDISPEDGTALNEGTIFRVPPTPVMCVVDAEDNAWVVTDADGSLTKIPSDATCGSCAINVKLPYHYALYHQTGPGLQIGPDGNPWFCVLNGEGLVGKVDKDTLKVTVFELLASPWNPQPRLCHISFDKDNILYAISSDLLDKNAVNTLIRIKFDKDFEQVIAQHELALPSQASCIHRIAHLDDATEPSVLVTELTQSQIMQVFKSTLPPLEAFPAKTMQLSVRKVYDANAPCPRTGNPVCLCEFNDNTIAIPEEPEFEGQEILYESEQQEGTPYINPRTGEKSILFQDINAWPNGFWDKYPKAGYDPSELQTDIYAANGATQRRAENHKEKPTVGSNVEDGVLRYFPDKLKERLRQEPSRIPLMTKEIQAAGLTVEEILNDQKKTEVVDSKDCDCEGNENESKLKP